MMPVSDDDELKICFLEEAKELLSSIEQCFLDLEKRPNDLENLNSLFRFAHNLKGSSGAVGFSDLTEFTHKLESLLVELKEQRITVSGTIVDLLLRCNDYLLMVVELLRGDLNASYRNPDLLKELEQALAGDLSVQQATDRDFHLGSDEDRSRASNTVQTRTIESKDENIRVSLSRISDLINNVGELVIYQSVLQQQSLTPGVVIPPLMMTTLSAMRKIIQRTRDLTMSLRMMPIRQTFQKMQRIVRDTSKALEKEVQLRLSGEDTEVDKTVLEQINDPLVHLVRNAIDHGLEDGDTRVANGKPHVGTISLSAFHRAGHVVIEVKDDGRGLDSEKLIQIAKSKGLIPENAQLTDDQAYQLIFAPGFSTKSQVTDVSGRGVGMDVVKTNITQLQGHIEIDTALGQGTCFRICLPLTLAIIDGIVVKVSGERYVVPLSQISEFHRPRAIDINSVYDRDEVLSLRNETVPSLRLEELLQRRRSSKVPITEMTSLIVRESGNNAFAIFVDEIVGQQQIVIKPLGHELNGRAGFMGSAILGDGKPALILDLHELVRKFKFNKPILNYTNKVMESA